MKYNTYTLPYGLRVIHLPSNSPVVYCGYEIAAGTRDEEKGDEGLAHFCEHVSFKGTRHRSAWNILNCLESVGGDLNAYTNKEDTVYYAAILKEHVDRAVDLLSDIVFQSTFPQTEIDKEVKVICDEIESYNDSPAELIYDDFENILFEGHPLGHNILGNAERVCRFTTEDAMRFTRKNYRPENMIFFAYGDVDFKKLIKKLEKIEIPDNASIKGDSETSTHTCSAPVIEKIYKNIGGSTIIRDKNTHQAHVMIGSRAYNAYDDEHRMPLYLLNNILGGMGMNAIFNVQLREKRGLVYTVDSSMVIRRVGMPYYTYYMIEFAGINPENGKPQFYTNEVGADGKLIKNITEKSSEANPIATKTPLPNVSLGLTNTFRYKIFDLSFTLSSTFGGWSYDSAAQKSQTSGSGDGAINQIPLYYRDSWQKPGDITKYEA